MLIAIKRLERIAGTAPDRFVPRNDNLNNGQIRFANSRIAKTDFVNKNFNLNCLILCYKT